LSTHDTVNVLIVDDDRAIQRMLADALTKKGFTVTVERDGDWALKTFEKKAFDAVLLDLLLPAMNGYDVARKMRSMPKGKRTPIIMISGVYKNALHQREAVEKHGAFAFLEKPLRLATLYQTLQDALGDKYPAAMERPPPPPTEDTAETQDALADSEARQEVSLVEQASARSHSSFQSIRGDFAQRAFPEVLAEIYRWKGTGALLLRREKAKKIVFFRDGIPQSIKSNLLSECLGRVMVREKMISEAECEESLKRMKASNRQQGTVLIEMGCISPHNLQYALTLQLQTKLFDIFAWQEGDFQFNPKAEPPADTVALEMSAAMVVYEGIRHAYGDDRISQALGDVANLYAHPSENPLYALQDVGVGEEERQLLEAVDGHKTVATLRALALLSPADTDRFLYAMKCAQMLELKAAPAEGKPKPSMVKLAAEVAKPPPLPPPPPPSAASAKSAAPGKSPFEVPWDAPSADMPPPPVPKAHKKAAMPNRPPEPKSTREPVLARAAGPILPELGGNALSNEESVMRERLVAKVAAMRKMDFFEILGVATTATREDIKRSYFALAKEYHPDKHFGSSSAEIRQLAGQVYEIISTAHDTLSDPLERERYTGELAKGVKRDVGQEVGKILAAEGKFQRGEELLRNRQYKDAHNAFQEAVNLYGDEGEFHAYLGWSLFQMEPNRPETADAALRHLEKAITLNPKLDKSYLFTGYIHKAIGRPDKAEKQFEKAIQCNPDCTEALRELRILGKARR
jgi:DNA-binding response OmpR family regulator/DnaJ-domain-containing protein 1